MSRVVYMELPIDLDELVGAIVQQERDAVKQLIVDLDEKMEDWDFTLELYRHFRQLYEEYKTETLREKADE